jgi:hypothetical protein
MTITCMKQEKKKTTLICLKMISVFYITLNQILQIQLGEHSWPKK